MARRRKTETGAAQGLRGVIGCIAGNAAVEFALAMPPLFMFVFGIIGFGRALWLQNALDYAVAEAARCASIDPQLCGTSSQIQNFAAAQGGSGFASSVFSVSTAGCGTAVSASYPLHVSIPFIPVFALTLTARACDPG